MVRADGAWNPYAYCRAYINFDNVKDILVFRDRFNGYVIVDGKGNEYPIMVELAPCQKVPKRSPEESAKKDSRSGTILEDADYKEFLTKLENPEPLQGPSIEAVLEEIDKKAQERKEGEKKKTPLIEYLVKQKEEKIKYQQEKRKRKEEERRRRDEERKRRYEKEKEEKERRRKQKEEWARIEKEAAQAAKKKETEKKEKQKEKEQDKDESVSENKPSSSSSAVKNKESKSDIKEDKGYTSSKSKHRPERKEPPPRFQHGKEKDQSHSKGSDGEKDDWKDEKYARTKKSSQDKPDQRSKGFIHKIRNQMDVEAALRCVRNFYSYVT